MQIADYVMWIKCKITAVRKSLFCIVCSVVVFKIQPLRAALRSVVVAR